MINESRHGEKVSGRSRRRVFFFFFLFSLKASLCASISPTSPYKQRNWLHSADQAEIASGGGQRGWQDGHAEQVRGEGGKGESIPKGLLSFIPKIESSISIQATALQYWK